MRLFGNSKVRVIAQVHLDTVGVLSCWEYPIYNVAIEIDGSLFGALLPLAPVLMEHAQLTVSEDPQNQEFHLALHS